MPQDDTTTEDALPKELTDAIAVVKAHAKQHGEQIVEAFEGTPVYQIPSTAGHRAGTQKYTNKDTGLLVKAQARIAELEQAAAESAGQAPDVEKIKAAYERQLKEKDDALAAVRGELGSLDGAVKEEKLDAALSKVFRPTAAKYLKRELVGRVRRTADGKGFELLDPDSPDVVMKVPKGKTVFEALAEEAKTRGDIEPEDVLSPASPGGGGGRHGGGAYGGARPSPEKDAEAKVASGVVAQF